MAEKINRRISSLDFYAVFSQASLSLIYWGNNSGCLGDN